MKTIALRYILLLMVFPVVVVGCDGKKNRTTDKKLELDLLCIDGVGGRLPGPTEWHILVSAKVSAEKTPGKDKAKKPAAEPMKQRSFRVLTDFMVDPMMYGWQNNGRQATSIQNPEDFEKFKAMVQKNPTLTNPRIWKGDTPDKKLSRALQKYKIDLTKEALVVLRYSTGPKDKVVTNSDLKNGVLTVKVSKVHVGNGGPQPLKAVMKPIAVVVDRSKVDKVVFEYWGRKSETKIRKGAGKAAPKVKPARQSAS
jgi:hypothetical protein